MYASEYLNKEELDRTDKKYQAQIAELDKNLRNLDFNSI
jgi:hypothetical protein